MLILYFRIPADPLVAEEYYADVFDSCSEESEESEEEKQYSQSRMKRLKMKDPSLFTGQTNR